jgi:hypothetical protein
VAVSGFIINNIPFGPVYRTSAVFLFLHMLVTYVIKGQVCAAMHTWRLGNLGLPSSISQS